MCVVVVKIQSENLEYVRLCCENGSECSGDDYYGSVFLGVAKNSVIIANDTAKRRSYIGIIFIGINQCISIGIRYGFQNKFKKN